MVNGWCIAVILPSSASSNIGKSTTQSAFQDFSTRPRSLAVLSLSWPRASETVFHFSPETMKMMSPLFALVALMMPLT